MSKIDSLLQKGKLKHAAISEEMYIKEYNISKRDLVRGSVDNRCW